MDAFATHLNELLQNAFASVLKIEEQMLRTGGHAQLSISDIHLMEAVGKGGERGRLIGEVAKELAITPPTVTIAVRKLEAKGMLRRTRGETDGRTVWISLTETGRKVDRIHRRFHENMVNGITEGLEEQERAILLRAMEKLNEYFGHKLLKSPSVR